MPGPEMTSVPAPLVVSPPLPLMGPEIASVSPGFVTVTIVLVSKATGAAIAWLPALSVSAAAAVPPLRCSVPPLPAASV